ncbi:hypothetical protein ADIARSV_2993 [Arcticibacter svalbardensis MN12-7]|uniref:Lipoprotein n=1 Tax=Arcticibacter svalbardensis MN12-7 TaxID=1150600 RepID=R9GQ56_9SPHI|nr:hypothetical protein [Arcticibacter svalbardensis]EOR93856.1 hypothetical protein ADIARSV_2993 [Arcticibacter svalbardensis MN12-7]
MKTNPFTKQLTVLILSGILILGCKKTTDQVTTESGAVSATTQNQVSLATDDFPGSMTRFTTVYNTDYLSVGTGGLTDGAGEIRVTGTFPLSSVTKAYLYWHGESRVTETKNVGDVIYFDEDNFRGTCIGVTSINDGPDYPPFPVQVQSLTYRLDVTDRVKETIGRTFKIREFGRLNADGASLILFYQDGNSNNNRDIVLFNGNDSNFKTFRRYPLNPKAALDLKGWDVVLPGVNYTSGKVNISMHVADGQDAEEGIVQVNGGANLRNLFRGRSVPGEVTPMSVRYDIVPIEVSAYLRQGIHPIRLTLLNYSQMTDKLNLVAVVFNLPKGAAPANIINVPFDFKPVSCPNKQSFDYPGTQKAAILGTGTFNVNQIDRSSLELNGLPIKTTTIRDVAAPYSGTVSNCSTCSSFPADGIKDLELVIDQPKKLGSYSPQDGTDCFKLTLTGKLLPQYGSTPIEGVDFMQMGAF